MADELPLAHNETQLVIMRPSVTLGIILLNYRERTVEGLTVRASRTNQSGYNNIFFEKSTAKNLKSTDLSSIYLPKNLIVKANKKVTNNFRVTSFLFGNSNLFRTKEEEQSSLAKSNSGVNISKTVNSKVFSVAVKTVRLQNLTDDEEIISSFLPLIPVDSTPTECVFWDFSGSGGLGYWSSKGCITDGINNGFYQCRCNHLTNFAILMALTGKGPPPKKEERLALELITYVGCGISLAALLLTFTSFVIFKAPRKKLPARILMCLCMSLIVTLIVFLVGITRERKMECAVIAIFLHYSVLASFCWMAVEGYSIYRYFVKVIGHQVPGYLWKASIFAWGLPLVIVAITSGTRFTENYGIKYGKKYMGGYDGYVKHERNDLMCDRWVSQENEKICMVHGTVFYVAYLTPILLIVCCNLIILGFVLKTLSKNPSVRKDQKMDGMTKIRVAVGCSILMGLTWIIGLLAVADLKFTFQVLFCVLNSLQGLFIFIFYCVRNQDIRKELMMRWSYKKNKYIVSEDQISREKHSKPATSSETASTLPSIVSIPFVQRTDETVHSGHVRQNKTNDIADIKTIVCTKTDRL